MQNVSKHFQMAAVLASFPLCAQVQAAPDLQGGGRITVDGRPLTFQPLEATAGAPQAGLKTRIFRIKGHLLPPSGPALHFEVQVTQDGRLYRMHLFRGDQAQEQERWAATLKTQVKVVALEPRVGGVLRLKLSGPLSGVVDGRGRQGSWDGEIWVTLQAWPKS